ncbi:conserved hypothetical protein [Candidatus Sulfopaludibacter sp. SbA6]|nr:conserved hypothetical protein [Candidatus Sulfopaludibacter sp. SbA6]
MTRVLIVAEGQTERSFVSEVLAEALWPHNVLVTPTLLGEPGQKGGRTDYARVKSDVLRHLKQDPTACCSTMLDFYGLGGGFPGTPVPSGVPNLAKVTRIEQAVKADIGERIPDLRPDLRFLPYIQLHEYEALLFSDPPAFATAIGEPHLARVFQRVRDAFPTPEDIDDGSSTAPSKRVLQVCHLYRKVVDGTIAARAVGINAMRRECPHFRDWLERLEALAPQ